MERTYLLEPTKSRLSKRQAGRFPGEHRQLQQIYRAPIRRVHRGKPGVRASLKSHAVLEAISFLILLAIVLAALAISLCAVLSSGGGRAGKNARSERLTSHVSHP